MIEKLGQPSLLYRPILAGFAVVSVLCVPRNKMTREGHAKTVAHLAIVRAEHRSREDLAQQTALR